MSSSFTYLPLNPVNCSGDVERLREEALDLAGALHEHLVVLGELVHAENRDDVLQILVALQHLLHALRDRVVILRRESCGSMMRDDDSSGSTAG